MAQRGDSTDDGWDDWGAEEEAGDAPPRASSPKTSFADVALGKTTPPRTVTPPISAPATFKKVSLVFITDTAVKASLFLAHIVPS